MTEHISVSVTSLSEKFEPQTDRYLNRYRSEECNRKFRLTLRSDWSKTGNSDVFYKHLDLASLKSVRSFAENLLETENSIDLLINNAGFRKVFKNWKIQFFGRF
ncbi:hypothetical protein WMY93_034319 [Mugilogobius chulae]|uniref:Uncharacterized protein n=1 Tax=Mugilogobius chulae TaxID=88201 RepID=A0AAW0MHJ2_9GOBI